MSKQKTTVHLRVYKGNGRNEELSYDSSGKVQNENILVKLSHNSLEWSNFIKNVKLLGYVKPTVEAFLVDDEEDKSKIDAIQKEVDNANKVQEVELTPEQKRIAELEAKLDALVGGKKDKKQPKDTKNDDLEAVRAEYEEVVGKKPFHGWDEATLKAKIEEVKNS